MTTQGKSLYSLYRDNAKKYGDHLAFITPEEHVSYEEFLKKVDALASGLAQQKINKGDVVCILAPNSVAYMETFLACAKLGAILFPINWRLSSSEIREVLALAGPKMLVVSPGHLPQLEEVPLDTIPKHVIFDGEPQEGFILFSDLYLDTVGPAVEISEEDPVAIISTAAVAGLPRGAVLTHGNLIEVGKIFAETFELTGKDRFLAVLPFFHIAGINMQAGMASVGGASVIVEAFDPQACSKLIDSEQISMIVTFPPMLEMMLDQRKATGAKWEALKYCFGILNPPEVVERFLAETGAEYWTGYGQAETTGIVTLGNYSDNPRSAGKTLANLEMQCVNDEGETVPAGEAGEIAVRGPLVFAGYWRDEDASAYAARFGWHHTGDVGQVDEAGYLYYIGRKPEKELIKSGGENIYPAEVEHAIQKLAAVAKVCVIGVPDETWGETVKAIIELNPGEELSPEAVKEAVAAQLASYKKPRVVEFIDSMPLTEGNEIDRLKVREVYG